MKTLGELRTEATDTALHRRHALVWASPWHGETKSIQRGTCAHCGMDVDINTRPEPNGVDIGGTAIALNCARE